MSAHCCATMREQVERTCDIHSDRYECGDCLIDFWPDSGRYGIMVHDGGASMVVIAYCPWCATKLPDAEGNAGYRMMDVSGLGFAKDGDDDD